LAGHDRLFGARRLFDLRTEANVPTFVSALTLLAAGIAAALLAAAGAEKPRRWVTTWTGVAAVLVFCAVDEAAQIHEHAGSLMRGTLPHERPVLLRLDRAVRDRGGGGCRAGISRAGVAR
jgi:hypothetical protein